ncbi:MAG: hypothetical protein ABII90_09425 [Bacteroidota bacterium]
MLRIFPLGGATFAGLADENHVFLISGLGVSLVRHIQMPVICIASPILTHILKIYSPEWFKGYEFGYELIVVNGMLTFGGLLALTRFREKAVNS